MDHPDLVSPRLRIGSKLGALRLMLKTILTLAPDLDRWETQRGDPLLANPVLAQDSQEWRAAAEQTQLALLGASTPVGNAQVA